MVKLRSGKTLPDCVQCQKYFGSIQTFGKCSTCFKGIEIINSQNRKFKKRLQEFADEKTKDKSLNNILKKIVKNNNCKILLELHHFMISNEKYITAEFASEILGKSNRNQKLSHIVCSLIIDWWNMVNYKFNGTEMCYYGRFGDPYDIEEIKTIPPPPPNRLMLSDNFILYH